MFNWGNLFSVFFAWKEPFCVSWSVPLRPFSCSIVVPSHSFHSNIVRQYFKMTFFFFEMKMMWHWWSVWDAAGVLGQTPTQRGTSRFLFGGEEPSSWEAVLVTYSMSSGETCFKSDAVNKYLRNTWNPFISLFFNISFCLTFFAPRVQQKRCTLMASHCSSFNSWLKCPLSVHFMSLFHAWCPFPPVSSPVVLNYFK